jgi:hypothetical protein
MFGLILMLQTAPIQDAPSPVDSVTVSPEKPATKRMPLWSEKIQPRGLAVHRRRRGPLDPGVRQDRRHARRIALSAGLDPARISRRTDRRADGVALAPYRSEKLVEEVDCGRQLFRRLKAYRHGDNNLEGQAQALGFTEAAWTAPEPDTFDATIVRDACL